MGFWTEQRVVVTGGAGFLGGHVVDKLREAGCQNVFVVRSREYDLTTEAAAERLFAELKGRPGSGPIDTVFHLAGLVGGIGANKARPADFFYQNAMMGVLTMHQAWKAGARKFVAAGAGCGYPERAALPLQETTFWDGFPQNESAPYSLAKRMLHVQSLAYAAQHGFSSVICIPGNIYGPRDNFDLQDAHVVPALVRKFADAIREGADRLVVWGSGNPTRDFVYAADVAEGLLRAAEIYGREPQLVNLSSSKETSIREVVETLIRISGFRGEVKWDRSRPDGQARRAFDVSKARRELDWQARTSLEDGLRRTFDWYQANRLTARNQVA